MTSSYLNEERFSDIQLETVLHCIEIGLFSMSHVLLIIADNCELQDKIRYNLPEAAANTHDWITVTKSSERISQVLKLINKKKDPSISETLVLTIHPWWRVIWIVAIANSKRIGYITYSNGWSMFTVKILSLMYVMIKLVLDRKKNIL